MVNLNLIGKQIKSISVERTAYSSNNFATFKIELKSGEKISLDTDIDTGEEIATKAYEAMFDESEQHAVLKQRNDELERLLAEERRWIEVS